MGLLSRPARMIMWHGSPFRFGRFNPLKLGTGEGSQKPRYIGVAGQGFYFGGDKAEAMRYRKKVSKGRVVSNPTVYKVGVDAKPDQFLHLDKPVGEQSPTVQRVLSEMGIQDTEISGWRALKDLGGTGPGERPASVARVLSKKGIKGTYFDKRNAPKGKVGYVVFDPKTIRILERYGWMGLNLNHLGAAQASAMGAASLAAASIPTRNRVPGSQRAKGE